MGTWLDKLLFWKKAPQDQPTIESLGIETTIGNSSPQQATITHDVLSTYAAYLAQDPASPTPRKTTVTEYVKTLPEDSLPAFRNLIAAARCTKATAAILAPAIKQATPEQLRNAAKEIPLQEPELEAIDATLAQEALEIEHPEVHTCLSQILALQHTK